MTFLLKKVYALIPLPVRQLFKHMGEDEITSKAAALSYNSLLSLVPLSVLIISVFSLFPGFGSMAEGVKEFVYQNLVPTAGDTIEQYFGQFVERAATVRTVGVFVFLVTSLMLLSNIENTLNSVFKAKQGRSIIQRITVYWAMLTLGPILLGSGLAVSSYIFANKWFQLVDTNVIQGLQILPFFFEMVFFLFMFMLMPNRNVPFKYAVIGAFTSTVLFTIAQKVFIVWASSFQSYTFIYGALATIPIFLVWLYVSWLVILTGAEIAALPGRNADDLAASEIANNDHNRSVEAAKLAISNIGNSDLVKPRVNPEELMQLEADLKKEGRI